MTFVVRLVKRAGVLVPGLLMAYVGVYNIFPEVEKFVHFNSLAILATYIITAYILIPALLRLIRFVFPPSHVPLYCTTPDGFASDPVNIGVLGTQKELATAMTKAGWYVADRRTPRTLFKFGLALLLRQPYPSAPFSNLYLFGRKQDVGFELPVDNNPRHRHHVRFWAASHTGDPRHLDNLSFWEKIQKSNLRTGRVLWVGAASLDIGIGIIRHNAQLTHMIHHETDAERELIANGLKQTGLVEKVRRVAIGKPYSLRNRVVSGYLKADGKMVICELQTTQSGPERTSNSKFRGRRSYRSRP